jgi:transposase
VKRKVITYTKKKKGLGSEKYEASLLMMRSEVMEALASKKKIIFIDEAMFTYSTNAMLAYAPNRQNICVDEKLSSAPAIAMVAGVSVERGLETWLTKPRSIDSDAFISFIEGLVAQNQSEEIALFLDNATIHRSKKVTSFLKDSGIEAIYNVPYSPQFNPIEHVWAQVKAVFKRRKLELLLQERAIDYKKLAIDSLKGISGKTISSICQKVLENDIMNLK